MIAAVGEPDLRGDDLDPAGDLQGGSAAEYPYPVLDMIRALPGAGGLELDDLELEDGLAGGYWQALGLLDAAGAAAPAPAGEGRP